LIAEQLPGAFARAHEIALDRRFDSGMTRTSWGILPTDWRTPEDAYYGPVVITELLLQSHDGVIRLFPCWPVGQPAGFEGLRTRGGFVVSSQWLGESSVGATRIHSIAGETCRLRWKDSTPPQVRRGESMVAVRVVGEDIIFDTKPGVDYVVES